MDDNERVVTLQEAEHLTGRKVSTWRQDILKRRVPFVKLGRSVRIPISEIRRMIQQGWHNPSAD